MATLLVAFFAQALLAVRDKSPTFDEPAHIGAGLSYLKTGEFKVNLQHPPLLKEIAALPLLALGVEWPIDDSQWADVTTPPRPYFQWYLGQEVIFRNDPGRVLFWSRLPFVMMGTLLGWALYRWGRSLLGGGAAVAALFLYALDPNLVAHAALVTTDLGFGLFALLFLFALWRYLSHRTAGRLLLCGLALGAALSAKFTALILLPIAAVLMVWAMRWIPAAVPSRGPTVVDPYLPGKWDQRLVWILYALAALAAVAALVVEASYLFSGNPFLYLRGLELVNADHRAGYEAYLAGRFGARFWTYYLVAYLLKEPIATLLLVLFGLTVLLRRSGAAEMNRAFLLLPPAVLVLVYSLFSHNLGLRYILPAMPFLHLAGGLGLATLFSGARAGRRATALVLCAWLVLAAAGIYPDHLSYFNEGACLLTEPSRVGLDGGSACGPLWLDDSNVDWGQGLNQLKGWLDDNAAGRYLRLGYFGSSRPRYYGLVHERISVDDLTRPPVPGLHALSAHFVARGIGALRLQHGEGPGNWLLHRRPDAVVGHAYYIYDIPPAPRW
ncbi:MAG: glycosyltransferase family 39 protein [Acidobacteriota bacterium]